jgi:hypothetical protein
VSTNVTPSRAKRGERKSLKNKTLGNKTACMSSSVKGKAAPGFEPGNNGFANRDMETLCTEWQSTYDDSESTLTPQLTPVPEEALTLEEIAACVPDPDLAVVVELWDTLPEHVRAALRALAEAAAETREI